MIKILHGENMVESRKALVLMTEKTRENRDEVITLDGGKTTFAEIRNALESDSLFGKNRLVVIENFFSSPKSKEKARILEYLKRSKFDNDLVLWEQREIKKEEVPCVKTEIFKLNPIIFRFLESLRPGNSRQMLTLLSEVKRKEDPEMIFYMLIRQFRLLILAKDQTFSQLAGWQRRKLAAQARHFTPEQLKAIYARLLEIDFRQKTSGDPFSLSSRLDLFIASI